MCEQSNAVQSDGRRQQQQPKHKHYLYVALKCKAYQNEVYHKHRESQKPQKEKRCDLKITAINLPNVYIDSEKRLTQSVFFGVVHCTHFVYVV